MQHGDKVVSCTVSCIMASDTCIDKHSVGGQGVGGGYPRGRMREKAKERKKERRKRDGQRDEPLVSDRGRRFANLQRAWGAPAEKDASGAGTGRVTNWRYMCARRLSGTRAAVQGRRGPSVVRGPVARNSYPYVKYVDACTECTECTEEGEEKGLGYAPGGWAFTGGRKVPVR